MSTLQEPPAAPLRKNGKANIGEPINYQDVAGGPIYSEMLRVSAWQIGEKRAADAYTPTENHVGLAQVTPYQAFAHWRIRQEWIDESARRRGVIWNDSQMILRLYDVSFIEFNGLNAHRIQDHPLISPFGHMFIHLPKPGTWQLAEVGFLLRGGEFVPAARSHVAAFAPDAPFGQGSQAALLVHGNGQVEPIGNVWDQEKILAERRRPHLRKSLRFGAFAFGAQHLGSEGVLPQFVSELAGGQAAQGHEVHVFVPATEHFQTPRQIAGVHYEPLPVNLDGSPLELALRFEEAAMKRLDALPPFDAIHCHEWMTGHVTSHCPRVLSLSSIEQIRRQGTPANELSEAIEKTERRIAQGAPLLLTPAWLRNPAINKLNLDENRVRAFPMEGRLPNQWEQPFDPGQVKMSFGMGPFDRVLLFVGPLEMSAGVDILLEAMPTILHRFGNALLVYVGEGSLQEQLEVRAHQLGIAHALRLLGHVEEKSLGKLMRASVALVLPSRQRVFLDENVVDMARRAGRPVVTTHSGPAGLVRHEDNGLLVYDNPGSLVWAFDRLLSNPNHADRMGQNGRRLEDSPIVWAEVASLYSELCAGFFPELRELP